MMPDTGPRGVVDDLLELYAIDALEPDDAQRFETALRALDVDARVAAVREIRSTRDAVGRMAAEVAVRPSGQVRERLLAAIEDGVVAGGRPSLRSVPTAHRGAVDSAEMPIPAVRDAEPAPSGTDELSRQRVNRRRRIALAVTSAAAAVILVAGGVVIGRSFESTPAPSAPPVAQVNPLDELRTVMSAQDADVHRTKLTGMPGTVVVASSRTLDTAVVLLDQAPQPPDQRTYQLWLISNTHSPRSAGLVSGSTSQPVIIHDLTSSRTIGMTVEPAGGSPQPTGDVLAAVTI